jgi:hypothetical protein
MTYWVAAAATPLTAKSVAISAAPYNNHNLNDLFIGCFFRRGAALDEVDHTPEGGTSDFHVFTQI